MQVWLIEEERCASQGASLEPALRSLGEQLHLPCTLAGVSGFVPDLANLLRAANPQVLVVNTSIWGETQCQAEVLALGLPILLAGEVKNLECWSSLSAQHPLGYVPVDASPAELWCALWSLTQAQRREHELRAQAGRLQQRLSDRIIIEKAKGVVMRRLGISEEEAYQRLRMQSRRQRKQIRDIAQSILDTEMLLDTNGTGGPITADPRAPGAVPLAPGITSQIPVTDPEGPAR
jgi:hypothetical protein